MEEKSSFEYGQVNHALAAAMRTLIKEYMILITQLEHLQRQGLLSLQKLWFYIQPTMRTMEILASLGEKFFFFSLIYWGDGKYFLLDHLSAFIYLCKGGQVFFSKSDGIFSAHIFLLQLII